MLRVTSGQEKKLAPVEKLDDSIAPTCLEDLVRKVARANRTSSLL